MIVNSQDYGLIRYIGSNKNGGNVEKLKHLRNGLLCLLQLLKTHRIELKVWIKSISIELVNIVNIFKVNEDFDNIESICDILEVSLNCLSICLGSYSR